MFGPSNTNICTYIQVFDDDALEDTETFTVSLSKAVEDSTVLNLTLPDATVQILEDPTDGKEVDR